MQAAIVHSPMVGTDVRRNETTMGPLCSLCRNKWEETKGEGEPPRPVDGPEARSDAR